MMRPTYNMSSKSRSRSARRFSPKLAEARAGAGWHAGADARPCRWPAGGGVTTEAGRKAELVLRAKPSGDEGRGLALRTPRRMPPRPSRRTSGLVPRG
jgi:hypothetical protein